MPVVGLHATREGAERRSVCFRLPLWAYIKKYTAEGKIERSWGFAGTQGGGGIVNVDSLEELNALVGEYPLGPFSEVEVTPLVGLEEGIQQARQQAQAMMGQMSGQTS